MKKVRQYNTICILHYCIFMFSLHLLISPLQARRRGLIVSTPFVCLSVCPSRFSFPDFFSLFLHVLNSFLVCEYISMGYRSSSSLGTIDLFLAHLDEVEGAYAIALLSASTFTLQVRVTRTGAFPPYYRSHINQTCMDDASEDAYYSVWYVCCI